jgi:DNA-binding response OmpR family regulator
LKILIIEDEKALSKSIATYLVDDKIKGLNLGADDYLSKPFHSSEYGKLS